MGLHRDAYLGVETHSTHGNTKGINPETMERYQFKLSLTHLVCALQDNDMCQSKGKAIIEHQILMRMMGKQITVCVKEFL